MHVYARNRDYPEALVNMLLTVIEKTSAGGATLADLEEAYQAARDQLEAPSKKTIVRALDRLNLLFDPLYRGQGNRKKRTEDCADVEEAVAAPFPAIKKIRKNGQDRYVFTRELAARSLDLGSSLLMALSLYPQRGLLSEHLEVVMKMVFEDVLGRLATCCNLSHEIAKHVYVSGFAPANPQKNIRAIENVLRAIRNQKRVKFEYLRAYDGELTQREIEPYGFICRSSNWYLVGKDLASHERRVFLMNHIQRMEVVENSVARIPPDFSLREAYGSTWGVWTEELGEVENVRLRVEKRLAGKFRVTRYHDSQQVQDLPDGGLEVFFRVSGVQEMIPWLMTWGPTLEVLEPDWLRAALVENLQHTLGLYW